MRVPAVLFAFMLLAPLSAAAAPVQSNRPRSTPDAKCPHTQSYVADEIGAYRGKPVAPRKLTEMPPGVAYMAVYRHIGQCEAPLTMVEYRSAKGR